MTDDEYIRLKTDPKTKGKLMVAVTMDNQHHRITSMTPKGAKCSNNRTYKPGQLSGIIICDTLAQAYDLVNKNGL